MLELVYFHWAMIYLCAEPRPNRSDCFWVIERHETADECRSSLWDWRKDHGRVFYIENHDCFRSFKAPKPGPRRYAGDR